MKRLLVIGLDCATPELVFEQWRSDLPNLDCLMKEGIHGKLESTVPPITIPAWASMLSGKDPGQLGCYGFRNRKSHSYQEPSLFSGNDLKENMIWDYLEADGLESILIGVPHTYPPRALRGILVSSFLTPNKSVDYTYPKIIKLELDRIADGDYIIDVDDFRTNDKSKLLEKIYLMTKRHFKVAKHFISEKPWNFFMLVEMGIDRIQHGFWRFMDKNHRLYRPEGPYQTVIKDYYQYVDYEIGNTLQQVGSDVTVMVVSDHGAQRMDGAICINDWLILKGYLCLKHPVSEPTELAMDMIDFSRTLAWAEGGYCSRIFLNVKGREPRGVVPESDYESFRSRLKEDLQTVGNEMGCMIGTRVFKPEDIYRHTENIPPDLIVYFGDLKWRAASTVGNPRIHLFENNTGPDDANHSQHGIFILKTNPETLKNANLPVGSRIEGLSIYDIAPTIMEHYGFPIPPDMIGRSIIETGHNAKSAVFCSRETPIGAEDYTEEESAVIRKRLESLGYF